MSETALLFFLRLTGAAALLVFFGALLRFLHQDLKAARWAWGAQPSGLGALRVLASDATPPAVDSLIELSPVTTIGRSSRNTIILDDSYVSAEHALLTWRDGQWWLEDLSSRNGTLLNDVMLTDRVVLSTGDVITIGGTRMKLETPGGKQKERGESGIRDSNP